MYRYIRIHANTKIVVSYSENRLCIIDTTSIRYDSIDAYLVNRIYLRGVMSMHSACSRGLKFGTACPAEGIHVDAQDTEVRARHSSRGDSGRGAASAAEGIEGEAQWR